MKRVPEPSPSTMLRNLIVCIFVLAVFSVPAQYRDAGAWTSFTAEYKPVKGTEFSVSPEFRLYDNFSRVSNAFVDVGVQQRLVGDLDVSLTYRAGYRDPLEVQIWRQRIQTGFSFKREFGNWSAGFASRFQVGFVEEDDDSDPDFVTTWRNKWNVKYKGLKKWELAGTFEIFHSRGDDRELEWTDWRATAQAEYKFSKRKFMTIGYLVQRNLQSKVPEMDYVVLLSYKYILKKKKQKDGEEPVPAEP